MNILLTGANGKIGKKLIKLLGKEKDINVFSLSRSQNKNNHNSRIGNLSDPKSLISATKNIDQILHLAALTHSDSIQDYYSTNLEGTKNLVKASQINKVKKFIFVSTQAASPLGGAYADSKFQAEKVVKNSQLDWLILRPSEVYGVEKGEAIEKLIHQVKNKRIIFRPYGKNIFLQPVHVDDVVDAIIETIKIDTKNKTYLLAGPEIFSYSDLIQAISQFFDKKIWQITIPFFLIHWGILLFNTLGIEGMKKDQPKRLRINKPRDITLAQKDLNFSPRRIIRALENNPHEK